LISNGSSSCAGAPLISLGNNLDSGHSCGFTAPGDIQGRDPRLGRLADQGGFTRVYPLQPGSPGIDAYGPARCLGDDQRGTARPAGPRCDIGAFELTRYTVFLPYTLLPQP
jgi:hypothetical protein